MGCVFFMWLFALALIVGPIAAVLGYIPWWITTPDSSGLRLVFAFWYAVVGFAVFSIVRRAWREMRRLSAEPDEEWPDEPDEPDH
jgi:membrane protein implicated in regulation of membrane protease activity